MFQNQITEDRWLFGISNSHMLSVNGQGTRRPPQAQNLCACRGAARARACWIIYAVSTEMHPALVEGADDATADGRRGCVVAALLLALYSYSVAPVFGFGERWSLVSPCLWGADSQLQHTVRNMRFKPASHASARPPRPPRRPRRPRRRPAASRAPRASWRRACCASPARDTEGDT